MTAPGRGAIVAGKTLTGQEITGWAEISQCRTWRYALTRRWAPGPLLGWAMLNPSRADGQADDMTIGKCMAISWREGFAGIWVANLFAFRSPSPAILAKVAGGDPRCAAGPGNDLWIAAMLASVPRVVLAWGAHGGDGWAASRRETVLAMAAGSGLPLACLGRTAGGEPRHPCRLAHATFLVPWSLSGLSSRKLPGIIYR